MVCPHACSGARWRPQPHPAAHRLERPAVRRVPGRVQQAVLALLRPVAVRAAHRQRPGQRLRLAQRVRRELPQGGVLRPELLQAGRPERAPAHLPIPAELAHHGRRAAQTRREQQVRQVVQEDHRSGRALRAGRCDRDQGLAHHQARPGGLLEAAHHGCQLSVPCVEPGGRPAVGKFCVPDVMGLGPNQPLVVDGQAIGSSVEDVTKGGNIMMALQRAYEAGEKVVSDIVQSYSFIILGLAVAMVLSFFYILLLRWVTGVMVWSSILLVLVLLGVGLYACYAFWAQLKDGSTVALWGDVPAEFRGILDDPTTWMAFMIVLAIILGVLLLMVLFLRKRISLAVTLIEQGGKAVSSMTSTLFFPVVPWALQVAVVAYTATVVLYLATSGVAIYKTHGLNDTSCTCVAVNINRDGVDCIPSNFNHECSNCIAQGASCQFFRYNPPDYTKWLHVFNIFGAIWTLFFISGMAQMILAATFATWYWTFHKSDVPFFVLTRSFFMSITYHTGTVAFGSLIISIVRFIRLILDYIEKQAKQYSDNSVAKCVMCCCKCCFACVEGFLKFISRNAYIMCAVHGKNFCASAKDAFNLLMRNVIRVVVIDKITDFVFFMGKLLITAVVCTAVYFSLRQWPPDPKLNYNAVPVTVTGVGSFLIASVFFGVYSVAVDTLFLCFLEDCERNDGTAAKPYYMSPSLMRIFGKKNRRD
ncbi:hypothetical protein FOCC_FOCC006135 [Frankliniella occidentalis]|nr:hypothetical protein FOCC_FOCC006135 [Frankliniella occidentalis]